MYPGGLPSNQNELIKGYLIVFITQIMTSDVNWYLKTQQYDVDILYKLTIFILSEIDTAQMEQDPGV